MKLLVRIKNIIGLIPTNSKIIFTEFTKNTNCRIYYAVFNNRRSRQWRFPNE